MTKSMRTILADVFLAHRNDGGGWSQLFTIEENQLWGIIDWNNQQWAYLADNQEQADKILEYFKVTEDCDSVENATWIWVT